jgi:hypothetical protein
MLDSSVDGLEQNLCLQKHKRLQNTNMFQDVLFGFLVIAGFALHEALIVTQACAIRNGL